MFSYFDVYQRYLQVQRVSYFKQLKVILYRQSKLIIMLIFLKLLRVGFFTLLVFKTSENKITF